MKVPTKNLKKALKKTKEAFGTKTKSLATSAIETAIETRVIQGF